MLQQEKAVDLSGSEKAPTGGGPTYSARRRCLGLFERKERWGLSLRGWLLFPLLVLGTGTFLFLSVHPFLALNDRVAADVLVVEGWVHDFTIRAAAEEFKQGKYQRVFTVGGPVNGTGPFTNEFNTSASVGADRLKAAGVPHNMLQMVPSRVKDRDRTFNSAVALRDWFREHQMPVRRLNVVTEDVHGRRSRLLFRMAFGKEVEVGVIAVPSEEYPGNGWWRYSEGVKEVISEGAAYIYARFLFRPPPT